ncbi:MAG TPA: DUF192 domain-containing protein [Steroidobacter sp.]|uniref:DUF192 domain-containing protein n=1 Tax=Steroidobacter sp. TaxID=1978227 RepID=UPI002EDABEB9
MSNSSLPGLVTIVTAAGVELARQVKFAASFRDRALGLLGRRELGSDEGMLFEPGGSIHTLWMRITIDVAFLDHNLHVLKISDAVAPWQLRFAPRGTRYTLELANGRLAACNLRVGERLRMIPTRLGVAA